MFESIINIDVDSKILENRVKVVVLLYIPYRSTVRDPSVVVGEQVIMGVTMVGGFITPALGKCAKFVDCYPDAEDDGEG
jgi:hypothetical protein